MVPVQRIRWMTAMAWLGIQATTLVGCGAPNEMTDEQGGGSLSGSDEAPASDEPLSGPIAVGTQLVTLSNANLHAAPNESSPIVQVIPSGSSVGLVESNPTDAWYKVSFQGIEGWCNALVLAVEPSADTASSTWVAQTLARAAKGVGFSYWWGHGRWSDPTKVAHGSCSGSCPSCTHGGAYGADCSGFVAKAWGVPSGNSTLEVDKHPYSTKSFAANTKLWKTVAWNNVKPGDALVYDNGSQGHIVLVVQVKAKGDYDVYEARGCATGIVHNRRTFSTTTYHAIRYLGQ